MKHILFPATIGLTLVILAACLPSDEGVEMNSCGAEALQELLGQPESALEGAAVPEITRVIRPGDAVTLDFNPARLNVELDVNGAIAGLRCG
ncbi:I78 family peptidase inhibitor [Aliiroseovarius sp.]|uniref:I78 family peptidase inhibitor n=1 Tax=Aliiroseovarius sp. TaxID=1872442 RepID=UPI003BAB9643